MHAFIPLYGITVFPILRIVNNHRGIANKKDFSLALEMTMRVKTEEDILL